VPTDLRWRLHLRAAPAQVFELLATDAGRMRFWCEHSQQHGERIEFEFSGGMRSSAVVLACEPPRRFALRYFDSIVNFELAADGHGGTDLLLSNAGIAEAEFLEVLPGWLNVLLPLKAMADFGIDLRNHDPQRSWQQGYVDG